MLQSKKEINLLIIVFIIIGIIGISIKSFEFYNIKIISSTTTDIFEHPLKVSNAALMIKLDVYKIHRDMKDVVLSTSNEELNALASEVNNHEQRVYKNFTTIEENILGGAGLKLEKKTRKLFEAWKPIRDEVASLMKNNNKEEAIAITKGIGAKHVLKLEAAAFELYTYAQVKANNFKNKSDSSFEVLKTINSFISVLFFLIFVLLSFYIVNRIKTYISKNEHLSGVLSIIRDINQLIVREKNPQILMQESCNILTATHIYSNAWIITYDKSMNIEYIASTDTSEKFIALKEKLMQGWVPHCIDNTINGNNTYSFIENTDNICSECPVHGAYDDKGAFNIAIKYDDILYGYLTLSINSNYVYDKDEQALLDEVAGDIAYAFYNIEVEKRLADQEERYRFVIEGTTDGLWDFDVLTKKVYFSSRWKEILGYSDDELENLFSVWQERVHPDDLAQVFSDIQTAQESISGQYRNIHRIKHKDGHWVWIDSRGQALFDENHKAIRMIGSHTDITKEKIAEDEIIRLKEFYNNIIDSVDSPIFVKDLNSDYITCNKAFENFIGLSKDQIIGKTDYDLFKKDIADYFLEQDQKIFSENKKISIFEWVNDSHDTKTYFLTTKAPLLDDQDNLIAIVGIATDFTEQQYLLERLEESQSIAKLGSWSLDINENILTWSDETYRIFGVDKEASITHEEFLTLVYHEDRKILDEAWKLALKGAEYNIEHRIIVDDKIKWINEKVKIEFDEEGKPLKALGTAQDITGQKEMQNELKVSKNKFEKAFNSTPNIILITNKKTGQVYEVNKTFEHIVGYKREELIGKTTLDVNIWNNIDERNTYVEALSKYGSIENTIFSLKKKNGDELIANVYASVIDIDNEEYILVVADDITEQVLVEKEGKKREEILSSIFQVIPDILFIMKKDGKIIDYHAHKDSEIYIPSENFINLHMQNVLPEDVGEIFHKHINSLSDDSGVKVFEYELEVANEKRYYEARMARLPANDNIMAIIRDVSERVSNEQQLTFQSELLEQSLAATDVVDEDSLFSYVNEAYVKMWGYDTKEEIIGTSPISHCLDPKMPKRIIAAVEKEKKYLFEFKAEKKDGSTFDALMAVKYARFMGKKFYIGSTMDITELKKKDEMLIAQSRLAAMGEMIGMIAHQWRQPLTVISMNANNMLLDIELDELGISDVKNYSDDILMQTQHLSKTIDDFRNFFKPDKSVSKVKLQEVLEETYVIIKDALANNNITLKTSYASESEVDAFSRELMQVFVNIITNAKDALLHKKSNNAEINIKVFEDEDYVITEVCDNGGGIDEAVLPKIFDPYFTTKDEKTGTGLGLFMSKMIIEDHLNGKIEASNKEHGACFRVKLYKPREVL